MYEVCTPRRGNYRDTLPIALISESRHIPEMRKVSPKFPKAGSRCQLISVGSTLRLIHAIVADAARNVTMPTDQEKLDYLNEIVRTRGYAHGSHRLLANHDLDALKAVNEVTLANYIPARSLS